MENSFCPSDVTGDEGSSDGKPCAKTEAARNRGGGEYREPYRCVRHDHPIELPSGLSPLRIGYVEGHQTSPCGSTPVGLGLEQWGGRIA
ncbi:MAG: hypothetical protein IH978_07600 [Nitrospinae bacterium]|nr:hypothetical protein [Nitrospinota bacterium]